MFSGIHARVQKRTRRFDQIILGVITGGECISRGAAGLMAVHLILLSADRIHGSLAGSVEVVYDCLGA